MRETCLSTTSAITAPRARRLRLAATALLLAAAVGLGSGPAATAETLNHIVLRVNDQIATLRDYQQRIAPRLAALNRSEMDPDERRRALERLPREVMREMLDEMLLLSRAEQLSLSISEADLDALADRVRELNQIESLEELRRAVAQSGQTWEEFRAELAKGQRTQEVLSREVYSRVELEEDDLRLFYRDNPELFRVPELRQLREVVVLDTSGLGAGELAATAAEIRRRLQAGEEMGDVVAEHEEQSLTSGVIDLDWVPKGDLDPNLEAAVEDLEPGQISEAVEGRGGLHIIQLLDRQPARVRPFDEVKNEIQGRERERLFRIEYPKYLHDLEEGSFIVAHPPPGAEGFRRVYEGPAGTDPLEIFRRPAAGETPGDEPPSR